MSDLTTSQIADFHTRLHIWYREHGRHTLPWRNTRDPYAIYLSEIMLQQTQVETVLQRFYHPFLTRFPTLSALAEADRQEVLKAWEGLGYYSRAANLHEASIRSAPKLPDTVEGLLALPGIGRNTAHAVASFAHHLPVPVMEANVRRVLCRIFALSEAKEPILWEKAEALLDHAHPFDYNQAMMDIGATICTKSRPACMLCPANAICQGKTAPERYPAPKPPKQTPTRHKRIAIVRDAAGRIYAAPRATRFLGGLYHFIEADIKDEIVSLQRHALAFTDGTPLGHVTQVYSHFTLEADVFLFTLPDTVEGEHWHSANRLPSLPWSQAEQKMLRLLGNKKA